MNKVTALLKLCRIQNIYLAFLDSVCMYILLSTLLFKELKFLHIMEIGVISSLLWISGAIQNDIEDIEYDKIVAAHKILPQGLINPVVAYVLAVCLQIIVLGYVCIRYIAEIPHLVATVFLLILSIYSYNLLTKKSKIFGSINMGICRTLNIIFPMIISLESSPGIFLLPSLPFNQPTIMEKLIYDITYIFKCGIIYYSLTVISYITFLSNYEHKIFIIPKLILIYLPIIILCSLLPATLVFFAEGISSFITVLALVLSPFIFILPIMRSKKINILSLLHIYVSSYMIVVIELLRAKESSIVLSCFAIFILFVAVFYVRIKVLKGIFSES